MTFVLPGDRITIPSHLQGKATASHESLVKDKTSVLRIGAGLELWPVVTNPPCIIAQVPGQLVTTEDPLQMYLAHKPSRRYVASVNDAVLGVVTHKTAEYYKVDVGAAFSAILPVLSFEGATKRNRPALTVGTLVYARVVSADPDLDVELSCTAASPAGGFRAYADGFGPLTDGYMFQCHPSFSRSLISKNSDAPVLSALAQFVSFEIAAGFNGRVWVRAKSPRETVAVVNALLNSEHVPEENITSMVKSLMQKTLLRS